MPCRLLRTTDARECFLIFWSTGSLSEGTRSACIFSRMCCHETAGTTIKNVLLLTLPRIVMELRADYVPKTAGKCNAGVRAPRKVCDEFPTTCILYLHYTLDSLACTPN